MIYDNIKALCKHHGIKVRDIESPLSVGSISRYESRGKIYELPIFILNKLSQASGVLIDDIIKKDLAPEIELSKIREEIERLQKREAEIQRERKVDDGVH